MARNLLVTPGTGATIAADEVTVSATLVKQQEQKIAVGKVGTFVGDLSGRLVDGTSDEAAIYTDHRAKLARIQVTPTVSTTPAYTAKDCVGAGLTFASAVRASGGACVIEAVQILDKGQQMSAVDLVLFDRAIGATTDNAIFAPSDADMAFCVGGFSILASDYADLSTNSVASITDIDLAVVLNGTSLFGQLVARGTPTYTSTSDIVVSVTVRQL